MNETKTLEVNIFTNCSYYSPSIKIIRRTWESFCNTFPIDTYNVRVFVDKNPHPRRLKNYVKNLSKLFREITITTSLSDGYIQAIQSSKADIIFMLEHDWVFKSNLVNFTIAEIVSLAPKDWIYIRFNQFINYSDDSADPINGEVISSVENNPNFCKTNLVSNNPHLIHKERYVKHALKFVKLESGSKGIEENLNNQLQDAYLFGKLNLPPVLIHTNGRFPSWKVPLWRMKLFIFKLFHSIKKRIF